MAVWLTGLVLLLRMNEDPRGHPSSSPLRATS
jgi:hypothetical protein